MELAIAADHAGYELKERLNKFARDLGHEVLRVIGEALAMDLVRTFLNARFSHEDRHERRLQKIKELEQRPSR